MSKLSHVAELIMSLLLQCVLSDTVRHSSLPNKSLRSRQVWMPQFSAAPLLWRDNGLPVSMAVPCHAVLLGNVTNAVL